jgi:hypothetical protein
MLRSSEYGQALLQQGARSRDLPLTHPADGEHPLGLAAPGQIVELRVRGFDLDEGLAWWQGRVERAWSGLVEEARALVAPDRAIALRFLEVARQTS